MLIYIYIYIYIYICIHTTFLSSFFSIQRAYGALKQNLKNLNHLDHIKWHRR